ncbi:MAG: hypothetical protein PHY43_03495 [Verrucomicrobiales bacterium]|nr:hypothetical protein [Verrucomicrobiales bacterium]
MKTRLLTLAVLLSLARLLPAQTSNVGLADSKPLPALDFVLQQVVARAVNKEDANDNLFDMNYQYTRTRTWEYRNSSGELTSREDKSSVENKPLRIAAKAARLAAANKPVPPPVVKDEPVSETHSNIRGKALKVKDYSIPELLKRFQFTLTGREMLNGRPTLVANFKPASDQLPVNQFADKFLNKAAGRVWIDEEDYAIAQAHVYLTRQVNVLGGLVGAVWKFTYDFTRARTPEGYWFAQSLDWHLEGREVVINRIVDYHERKLDEQKIVTVATAR